MIGLDNLLCIFVVGGKQIRSDLCLNVSASSSNVAMITFDLQNVNLDMNHSRKAFISTMSLRLYTRTFATKDMRSTKANTFDEREITIKSSDTTTSINCSGILKALNASYSKIRLV